MGRRSYICWFYVPYIWVHRIGTTVVQIILRDINGESFITESIRQMCGK